MRFKLRREPSPQFFGDWTEYLRARARDRDRTLLGVLEESAGSARNHRVDVSVRGTDEVARAHASAGLPWLTLVVGSGCLNDPVAGAGDGDPLPAALGRVAATLEVPVLYDLVPAETLVARFARSLLTIRRASSATSTVSKLTEGESKLAARVLLCAAVSSEVYRLSLIQRVGPRPRDAEVVPTPPAPGHTLNERRAVGLAGNLRTVLVALKSSDKQFVAKLAHRILEDLNATPGAGLKGQDVDALVELAWHLMMAGSGHYLGWGELFTLLSVSTSELVEGMRSPYLSDLVSVRAFLIDGLQRATTASWKDRLAGRTTARQAFYDQIASISALQAEVHATASAGTRNFPLSSIFVTGFDIEVEMALLARGTPFVILAPFLVHAEIGTRVEVGFTWLMKSIDVPRNRKPALTDITSRRGWDRIPDDFASEATGRPVVVRVAGSPLVDPPNDTAFVSDLVEGIIRRPGLATGPGVTHALLLDEHAGLHQWLPEMEADQKDGIPESAFRNTPWSPRFWLLVGVQIGDAAIRQRIAALLSAIPLRRKRSEEDAELSVLGVASIHASDAGDRDVLNWRGVDVVRADFAELVPDLAAYLRRLEKHETWWADSVAAS